VEQGQEPCYGGFLAMVRFENLGPKRCVTGAGRKRARSDLYVFEKAGWKTSCTGFTLP
jgi:hypothetical protein